ncbi:MAG: CinA family protein [Clostridiales bacterium]|nr:CinA family protein [Clostridiales bacterium]
MDAGNLVALLRENKFFIATAESCTGGLISKMLTDVSGSSACFAYGFVTYSNEAKTRLLGVPEGLLERHGAVSEPVALAMAQGALVFSGADLALAVSGIAGPEGGSEEKPVGLVFIAFAWDDGNQCRRYQFRGNREEIRRQTLKEALLWAEELVKELELKKGEKTNA